MTSCDYAIGDLCFWCDAHGWRCLAVCAGCGRKTCDRHHEHTKDGAMCIPPHDGPDAGRGCYKPPVAEVAE